ncbi:MAG: 3-isopropylmalate dehydratase [Planctomycetota bacterium]
MSRAWCFGDDVDTDQIIPAKYLVTTDPQELAAGAFIGARPEFSEEVREGDVIFGGENFGCGSSREHAPICLLGSGVRVVVAASYARIFYRNSINTGLMVLECPEAVAAAADGDDVSVDLKSGEIRIRGSELFQARPLAEEALKIVEAGGLMALVKKQIGVGS